MMCREAYLSMLLDPGYSDFPVYLHLSCDLPSSISRTTGPLRATPNGVEGVPSHAVP